MKRLFIAINVIPNDKLIKTYNEIRRRCNAGRIKWVDAGLFHLTLKFLGETSDEDIKKLSKMLKSVADNTSEFTFCLKGIGIFGSSYRPRIIRVNIDDGLHLTELGNIIRGKLKEAGFPDDRQNFVPHLTLGRIKQVQNKALFQQTIEMNRSAFFQEVRVSEVILYESVLHSSGPEYIILEKFALS